MAMMAFAFQAKVVEWVGVATRSILLLKKGNNQWGSFLIFDGNFSFWGGQPKDAHTNY